MTLQSASVSGPANHYTIATADVVAGDWDAAVAITLSTLAGGLGLGPARS
ncbi:hypothetical protein [Gordonia oryzae]|nr:hypothetical protein [Gordonia oryzae]